ncbi:PHD finger protein 7-like [Cygnus atratus]|uniref:PHD finger protein 7-like n=1 Tax=Cygnus atratus TaxID=8868 RepID=UPI0021B78A03|nr:PHD finger protein 7-like [Cygnus atratus]XP_050572908.1 PHD finger protein 7-like [Cygnus atratus]
MGLLCSFQQCFVCGERGATITCTETGCERSFHLPCASEGECVTQFFGRYRSFCWEHRPQQAVQAAPEQDTTCTICMDPVGDSKSYHTMVCPACSHAWFHRGCIQELAIHTDNHRIKCPVCRNRGEFRSEMSIMGIRGIRVPVRGPAWENNNASASLQERCRRCTARECLYPQGREQAEGQGPWQLLLCRSCAAEGTHRRCSNLTNSAGTWECDSCAGVGTSSQAALWPLQGILVTDSRRRERDRTTIRHPAGDGPEKPLPITTPGPKYPEADPKTASEQTCYNPQCSEQQRQQQQLCQWNSTRNLQSLHGARRQTPRQPAGATPDEKPLTAGTSSPRSPEPAPKTPQEQPCTTNWCWEQQQHQICQAGGIGVPQWVPGA